LIIKENLNGVLSGKLTPYQEKLGVEWPGQYQIKNISGLDWGYYEYIVGREGIKNN